jgi:hypothetical protein
MPGLAIGLIVAVVLYEFLAKKPAVAGQSAARAGAGVNTTAAGVTKSLSAIEQALARLLSPARSSGAQPKAAGGGSPSAGSGGGNQASRPSQTGFNQPSNQSFTPTDIGQSVGNLSVYGKDAQGNDVYIDDAGNVFDANGATLTDLSGIDTSGTNDTSGVFSQSAPGDGGWDPATTAGGVDPLTGELIGEAGGNQDAALAQDASLSGLDAPPIDDGGGFFGDGF